MAVNFAIALNIVLTLFLVSFTPGKDLPHEFAARRAGDIALSYADTQKATDVLGWTARRTLEDMCRGEGCGV